MPRRRYRSTDPLVRDRNQLEILGAPGISGLSRIGSGPKGGTSIVVRPPANGLGTQIEHVTLHAEAGQTIAAGGGTVQWDRIAGPPTEIRGFTTAAEELASSGSVGAIPLPLTGVYDLKLLGLYESYSDGGDITITLARNGRTRAVWTVEGGPITSRLFKEEILGQIEGIAGIDTLAVTAPGDGTGLAWGQLQLRAIGVASATSQVLPLPLWVADGAGETYYYIDGATGAVLASMATPTTDPTGLAWDGAHLWSTNRTDDTIYKLDPGDGTVIDSFAAPSTSPWGLAWDGTNLWHGDIDNGTIYRLDPSDGTVLGSFAAPGHQHPVGLAWDGTHLWLVDTDFLSTDDTIYQIDPDDGSVVSSFVGPSKDLSGVAWGDGTLWVCDFGTEEIYRLDTAGTILETLTAPGNDSRGIVWAGS